MINSAINLRHLLYRSAAIALVAAATGCSIFKSETENDLDAAMAQWEANGYDRYSMRYGFSCFFCAPTGIEATVLVEADAVVVYSDATDWQGEPISDSLLVAWGITESDFESVEGLFDIIATAIAGNFDQIETTYHTALGYPESIQIDPCYDCTDDGISYYVNDVVEIQ